ncbi:MAG: DUF192 domain-containing protein [Puniceicoccaceae bacterium]|nr:MAG: DUF192 domain-containing protein [Puniceicoccaceae bacterium]
MPRPCLPRTGVLKITARGGLFGSLLLLLTACGSSGPGPAGNARFEAWFPLRVGEVEAQVQVAVRPMELQRGLMYREELGEQEGMLFVFNRPQKMSFWMRDTSIPLDIGYFSADGVLREIYALRPYDETPVESRSEAIQFALEMNRGWFRAHGVRTGARLNLDDLAAALRARGFDPDRYLAAVLAE